MRVSEIDVHTANGKLQIFQGNFHTFSTVKLLIHASILMQNTV